MFVREAIDEALKLAEALAKVGISVRRAAALRAGRGDAAC